MDNSQCAMVVIIPRGQLRLFLLRYYHRKIPHVLPFTTSKTSLLGRFRASIFARSPGNNRLSPVRRFFRDRLGIFEKLLTYQWSKQSFEKVGTEWALCFGFRTQSLRPNNSPFSGLLQFRRGI